MTLFWSKIFYKCAVMTLFRRNTQPKCVTITLFPHMPFFRHQRVQRLLASLIFAKSCELPSRYLLPLKSSCSITPLKFGLLFLSRRSILSSGGIIPISSFSYSRTLEDPSNSPAISNLVNKTVECRD